MNATALALVQVDDGQIIVGHEFEMAITELKRLAEGISVSDRDTCTEALEVVAKGKSDVKAIETAAEPERLRLQNALNKLRGQRDKIIAQIRAVIDPLEKSARAWRIAEQEAAAEEQAKLNRGKRAEDRVTVQSDVPSVPGARLVTKYRFEVLDLSKIKREFLCADETKINAKLREDKNPEQSMKEIGGIRAWKE